MSRPPCVVIVQNSRGSGPGRFPGWLADEGLDPVVVPGPELPDRLAHDVDALVLMGGGFLPTDDDLRPFLPRERALVRQAIDARVPVLGICLGAQLLAVATGGEVTARSGETERGSCAVELLPAADDDALLGDLARQGGHLRMIQSHEDSVTTLPPGAVLLATSDACRVQAFRVGNLAWGVQFHPEAAASRVREWDVEKLAAQGFDHGTLVAQADADDAVNADQARMLAGAFAKVVREGRR